MSDDSVPVLLACIDAERLRIRQVLSGSDESTLAERPPNGKWSVVENVRHLLFAEQAHLGRFVPGGRSWSPFGFTPEAMRAARKLPPVVSGPAPSVGEVFEAWETVHASMARELVTMDTERVRTALLKNLPHLRSHVTVIERLVLQAESMPRSS